MKHRVMTLRDDVVFLVFLYQYWIYRTDKTRENEFGIAYERGPCLPTSPSSTGEDPALLDLQTAAPPVKEPVD